MWKSVSLRTRVYAILSTLVVSTFMGSMIMVWYTFRMEEILTSITEKHLQTFQTAESLETALVNQKGFVSYYFLDGDPEWLRQLGEYRQIFKERLNAARHLADTNIQMEAIDRIEHEYSAYISAKDRVIAFYKDGDKDNGFKLHKEVRYLFFTILDLCEQYKEMQVDRIHNATENGHSQARKLRYISALVSIFVVILAITLIFFFIQHILEPLRKLAEEASRMGTSAASQNEIKFLSHSVRDLIEDVDQTHTELQKSRENLLQAEKMALVGKLAAGMAHSIRNPFTSVKMRMFSLGRTLKLTETQKDDLDVISQEIRHIDTIVQNFLEFSRPPKLKMQQVSPSVIVDLVIQLLEHRLISYEVRIEVIRKRPLPPISADPEQLKEVLVNLVVNACEAMKKGGQIVISEEETIERPTGKMVVIRVSDNGPGIPGTLVDKVLQPFFTTKEEGTGLGLSIASRIIEEHGGRLHLTSTEGMGTTFIITLPVRD
ncbi:MAG: histidine kinase [Deltaproteobacteria bacterium]|nr:histidine kinase [Deltaproteobacteria bacterium]